MAVENKAQPDGSGAEEDATAPDEDDDDSHRDSDDSDEEGADPDEDVSEDEDEGAPQKKPNPPANILPEGFIAIDQNGRTPDGSVPYIILKKQLERMR